jgi:TonB family protein
VFVTALFVLAGTASAQTESTGLDRPHRIVYKPKPSYTDIARKKGIEGNVLLRVTLLANGEVGSIENVTKKRAKKLLKYGLVDRAIEAAKSIRFEPKIVNGTPVSVVVTIDYGFTIY